jgi:YD repeat-containing protein
VRQEPKVAGSSRQEAWRWRIQSTPPSTRRGYDNLGNLSRVTRSTGASTERATDYQYDGRNRVRKELQYPSWPSTTGALVTSSTYDGMSNLLSRTEPQDQAAGHAISFGYDNLNRRTSITFSDGSTPKVTYAYDLDGNRTSMTDGTGTTSYVYDELDQVTSVTSPGARTVGYRHDLHANQAKIIYPGGQAVSYTYAKADRLQQLADWANRTSYTYNPDGSPNVVTNANWTKATYSYDNAQRLTQVLNQTAANGLISQHAYTLDNAVNRTQNQETVNGSSSTLVYTYDNLYRLTGDGANSYSYDAVGNRINQTVGGTSTTFTYDGADRPTSGGYTANDNGNLTSSGTGTSYGYDQANRLISASLGGGTTTASYTWGRRRQTRRQDGQRHRGYLPVRRHQCHTAGAGRWGTAVCLGSDRGGLLGRQQHGCPAGLPPGRPGLHAGADGQHGSGDDHLWRGCLGCAAPGPGERGPALPLDGRAVRSRDRLHLPARQELLEQYW